MQERRKRVETRRNTRDIHIRISEEAYKKIKEYADSKGYTLSFVVKDVIEERFKLPSINILYEDKIRVLDDLKRILDMR